MATPGEVIKRLREERGWTLDDLAARSGVSRVSINMRESGKTRVKPSELPMWAKTFEMSTESFRRMVSHSSLPLRAAENRGIPVINKAPAGVAWDFEHYGVDTRQGFEYIERLAGEESDDLFAVVVTGKSMEPELREGDYVVLWPVTPGVPPESINGRMVCVTFSEDAGGGTCLASLRLTGKQDDHRGYEADLVKLNPDFKGKRIWLTDLDRLAVATRVTRKLS